jgi:23S rRNA (cytidine1920-2'-O)/16S rRNA (cytidine1409-2'-O)-methyltransferase
MAHEGVNASGKKARLDALLLERGLAESRSQAQALVRAGRVRVDGERSDKPGHLVPRASSVTVTEGPRYVSRGGHKLVAALDRFGVDPGGMVCMDVGASTGGFTDVLVQRGATRVYAVDVGRGQLAWTIRTAPQVVPMERTDIRSIEHLEESPELVTVDVAFIGLAAVLPAIWRLLRPDGSCIALVKPQFEAGARSVGKGGIVRDPAVHREVLERLFRWLADNNWRATDAMASPVTGADGNREFLVHLRPVHPARADAGPAREVAEGTPAAPLDVEELVARALEAAAE